MFVTNEEKALQAVALQLMNGDEIVVSDQKLAVKRVRGERLRFVQFKTSGREIEAIEPNRKKPSARGQWARDGHQMVQFRGVAAKKYEARAALSGWYVVGSFRSDWPVSLCVILGAGGTPG
jgi:hypothetical protein